MQEFAVVCGVIAGALAIFSSAQYIVSIVRGQTKPHQFTFLIWMLMNGIVVFSQFLEGARASILMSTVFLVFSTVDFGLSFKYGVRNSSRYDRLLLGFALLTIVAWVLTQSNAVAIWLTVLIDIFASTMLILKLKKHPGSEPLWLWSLAATACLFTCLSLADKAFGVLYVRPIYSFVSTLAIVAAVWYFRPPGKKRAKQKATFPVAEEY